MGFLMPLLLIYSRFNSQCLVVINLYGKNVYDQNFCHIKKRVSISYMLF